MSITSTSSHGWASPTRVSKAATARLLRSLTLLIFALGCDAEPTSQQSQPSAPIASLSPSAAAGSILDDHWLCLKPAGGPDKIGKLQSRVRKLPHRVDLWTQLAEAWLGQLRDTADRAHMLRAEDCIKAALRVDADSVTALELSALLLQEDHRFTDAAAVLERVIAKDKARARAHGMLSDALVELGRYDEAIAAAQTAADILPSPKADLRSAYLRFLQGDAETAKALYRDALKATRDKRFPGQAAWAFTEAANLFWQLGDYDGADLVYQEASKWVADYPAALRGRGRVALSQGRLDDAISHLGKSLSKAPSAETAWLLTSAHRLAGNEAEAVKVENKLIALGSHDKLTLSLYYSTHDRDHDQALALIEKERKGRGGIYVDDAHAWALYRLGRHDDALKHAEKALALGTKDARLLYHAGAINIASGNADKGKALIVEALKLNPGFDPVGAPEARKLL